MSKIVNGAMRAVILAGSILLVPSAQAANEPTGLWYDHTGRGAVEITKCGPNLCGRVVWVQDAKNGKACGIQILGNVQPVAGGKWDNGWIYDPDDDAKYSVELTPMGGDRLKVLGYAGSKMFSETMTWRRAPTNLKRCGA